MNSKGRYETEGEVTAVLALAGAVTPRGPQEMLAIFRSARRSRLALGL